MLSTAQKSPDAFRTISEVAAELDVPQHVLRFWESKFGAVKPLKRGGGRRYYRPDDVDLLRGIRSLLYSDGLTIKGVQKILREQGPRYVMELGRNETGLLESARAARAPAQEPGWNVHQFRREQNRENGPEGGQGNGQADGPRERDLPGAERDRFKAMLDEFLELKDQMQAARRRADPA